jgi:hypothetical protein
MDSADGRFGVAKITRKTALACLGRLCSLKGIRLKSGPPQLHDDSREDLLPIGQLIAIAHHSGLRLMPIRFDWFRLLVVLSSNPVLLVLKNGNVIAAERVYTAADSIIAFDPLDPADEPFFLARTELEPVWDGDALTVEPELTGRERSRTRTTALIAVCGLLAAALLILVALKESTRLNPLFPTAGFLSLPLTKSAADSAPDPDKDAILGTVASVQSPGEISEPQDSTAAATGVAQQQGLTFRVNLPGAEGSSLERPAPLPEAKMSERTHEEEASAVSDNLPGPSKAHTADRQLASLPTGHDPSSLHEEEKTPTSPGLQPATTSLTTPSSLNGAVPIDATRPMMFPGQPIPPPTPSVDKPEAASESTKAPDAAAGAPALTNLTSNGIKALINRGDLLLGSGDITSARLFYERAANAPDAQAALRLGESYDPAFLQRARLNRAAGSVSLAAQWYQRAGELGAPEADMLLRALAIASRFSH